MEEGEKGLEEGILALFMEMALVMLLLQVKHEGFFLFLQFIWCNNKLMEEMSEKC